MGTIYLTDGDDLTSVANAIRAKSGGSGQLAFPSGFVSEIGNIPSGGGMPTLDDFCDPAYPSGALSGSSVTTIRRYCFEGRTGITGIDSSSITTIKERAFSSCTGLKTVNLPNLKTLQNGNDTNTNKDGFFFANCSALESFYAPNLEYVYGSYAFANTGSANNHNCVFVFPKLKTGSQRLFQNSFHRLFDLGPDLSSLLADAFYSGNGATRNKTVILRRTAGVVTAASADTIREITDVYCPNDLIASYKTASNWSTRFNGGYITFHAIEGSQYEHYYADGTPIPTT